MQLIAEIVFARNGLFSQSSYCFTLEAIDTTTDVHVPNTVNSNVLQYITLISHVLYPLQAKAHICIRSDPSKIHEADRPKALPLRARQNRKSNVINSEESIVNAVGFSRTITHSIPCSYPRDVYVYRTAQSLYRVTQPKEFQDHMKIPELKFTIAEDRSNAFAITPTAGIIYVRDSTALLNAPETVYL